MRLTVLSRASDLARIQASMVGRAISRRWPDASVTYRARTAAGDRNGTTPLPADKWLSQLPTQAH